MNQAQLQYKRGVQYESGTSSVQARKCSTSNKSSSFGRGGITQKYFPMNASSLLLKYDCFKLDDSGNCIVLGFKRAPHHNHYN